MKTKKSVFEKGLSGLILATAILAAVIISTNTMTSCKKEEPVTNTVTVHDTVKVEVHDTLKGKSISGVATYLDYAKVKTNAKGAVMTLYLGASKTGSPVATAFADATGNYSFPYLLPNNYFVYAIYNTENKNAKEIKGIDFATDPGYAVTLGSTNLTQDISLINFASTGSTKISLDTTTNNFRKVTLDKAHSRISFETDYGPTGQGAIFPGFFGALKGDVAQTAFNLTKFAFDETNPANTKIEGYVLLHERSTGEDGRDGLGNCGSKALLIDTINTAGVITARPETDTCKFISISVEKYGNGYLCKGKLRGFLMHKGPGNNDPICPTCPADTALKFTGPYDVQRELPVDMFFVYEGKKFYENVDPAKAYYGFPFEGVFTFDKTKFNIKHASIGNMIKVSCHVNIKGIPGKGY